MKVLYSLAILLMMAQTTDAQVVSGEISKSDTTGKKGHSVSISLGSDETKDSSDKIFDIHVGMVDLGYNYIDDKTNYSSAAAQNFLHVNSDVKNENLFSLREGKSINVNVYPVLVKARLVKSKRQRLYVSIGAGLQMYNFMFSVVLKIDYY